MSLDFRSYFRALREKENLSLKQAQRKSGISWSTIYKYETVSEISLNSAVMLLYGYQKNIYDIAQTYNFEFPNFSIDQSAANYKQNTSTYKAIYLSKNATSYSPVLTVEDVKNLIIIYQQDPDWVKRFLDRWIDKTRESLIPVIGTDSLIKFIGINPEEVKHSKASLLNSKMIEDKLLYSNAVLSYEDAVIYLRNKRTEEKLTTKELAEKSSTPFSVISRMELGQLAEIRFADAINLSNALTPDNGMLLAVFIRAAEFQTGVIWKQYPKQEKDFNFEWTKEEILISSAFLGIGRWFEAHKGENPNWISELRADINSGIESLKKP